MAKAHATLHLPAGNLVAGDTPLVVGTFSSLPSPDKAIVSDVAEFRLDKMHDASQWLERAGAIEAAGVPVIATVRLRAEGGDWAGSDRDRLPIYEQAIKNISAVDVELKSELALPISELAQKANKTLILSFHDFTQTPALPDLEKIIFEAENRASIVKIATMINSSADRAILEKLLAQDWEIPLCVIGMGALGKDTRVSFATKGSCLTYGYLDQSAAPGQWAAAELVAELCKIMPAYAQRDTQRRRLAVS